MLHAHGTINFFFCVVLDSIRIRPWQDSSQFQRSSESACRFQTNIVCVGSERNQCRISSGRDVTQWSGFVNWWRVCLATTIRMNKQITDLRNMYRAKCEGELRLGLACRYTSSDTSWLWTIPSSFNAWLFSYDKFSEYTIWLIDKILVVWFYCFFFSYKHRH